MQKAAERGGRRVEVREFMEHEISLSCKGLVKTYPGVVAMDHVNFELRKGEVHALLGENGAGKSTLIKAVAGAHQCDEGTITIFGQEFTHITPRQSKALGVEVVYQEFNQMPSLSVAENIFLTEIRGKRFLVNMKEFNQKAQALLDSMKVRLDPTEKVKNLTNGYKQMVEIAKAISKPTTKILILDEPTAPLTVEEVEVLFNIVCDLKAKGISIIYISHRMPEIFRICDRVTVMRDGTYVTTKDIADTNREELVKLMVGRELNENFPPRTSEIGEVVLQAKDLCGNGVENISFEVRSGEILGFAGLVGTGRTETLRLVFGADKMDCGEIYVRGRKIQVRSPGEALKHGIALLPEDRKLQGVLLKMSIKANINVSVLRKISRGFIVDRGKEAQNANKYIESLRIRTPSMHQLAQNLSGGNQQKVALGKCMAADTRILIMDEPTRGIDVGAKQEIYQLMRELSAQGIAIIMISSEMDELLGMSDRVVVMCEGCVAGMLEKEEFDQERILDMASGE